MRKFLCLLLLGYATLASAQSNFAFSNVEGPYKVGLRIVQQYDYTRGFQVSVDPVTGEVTSGEHARPMQTLIWYPSEYGGKRVVYGDYLKTAASETRFDSPQADIDRAVALMLASARTSGGAASVDAIKAQTMWASRDAKVAGGKFPVVVYAPSFGAPASENADLCEYLASQGYVVLASPSMGTRSREMSMDLPGIEAQAADIEFLIGYAHSLAYADTAHIAVVGYSWGGISNFFAAARDRRIGALADLDGSVRYWPKYVNGGEDAAKDVTAERVAVPLLYVGSEPGTAEKQASLKRNYSFSFINEMKYSDVYNVTMHAMRHPDFSSYFLRIAGDDEFGEYSRSEASAAQSWAARYVLNFLNDTLKHDAGAHAFLTAAPVKNGAPAHSVSVDIHTATATLQNRDTFSAELAKAGFSHAIDIYDAHHQANASFALSGDEVNSWGYALMTRGRLADSIEIFKLGTHVDPEDSDAFDSLGEAYENNQATALAIENYRRALQLNPKNSHALAHLKLLGGAPAM